jgi:hypothetical protein
VIFVIREFYEGCEEIWAVFFEDFINVFGKYEQCIKTVSFEDLINNIRRYGHWIAGPSDHAV